MSKRHLVFIFSSAPYHSPSAREGLDALLAAAVFDQKVSVLFIGEGVFQLVSAQNPSNQKNHAKMLSAMAMYDVDACYVHASSAKTRGIDLTDCCIAVEALDDTKSQSLITTADHVLSF